MTDYATHPDYRHLLAGICDEPESDLRRLVLADYLDEFGTAPAAARAEFVRVGCEWAALVAADPDALPSSVGCPNCGALPHNSSSRGNSGAGFGIVRQDGWLSGQRGVT